MTDFNRITKAVFNPIAVAFVTSALCVVASLTPRVAFTQPMPSQHVLPITPSRVSANHLDAKQTPSAPHYTAPVLTEAERSLAKRVSAALSGTVHSGTKPSSALRSPVTQQRATPTFVKPTPRVWVCGQWEELMQGRGRGRSCDWR